MCRISGEVSHSERFAKLDTVLRVRASCSGEDTGDVVSRRFAASTHRASQSSSRLNACERNGNAAESAQ